MDSLAIPNHWTLKDLESSMVRIFGFILSRPRLFCVVKHNFNRLLMRSYFLLYLLFFFCIF